MMNTPALKLDASLGATILRLANELAAFSDEPGGLTCAYLTAAHRASAELLRGWMSAAGMRAHIDAVGNVVGHLPGRKPAAKTLLIGSHYDTVRQAGKFDGRLGILLPIVIVALLRDRDEQLDFDLEVIGFAEEEGVRFQSTFLGSSAIAGHFDEALLERRDAGGLSMREVVQAAGHEPAAIASLGRDAAQLLGFLEIHIEQGPVLLDQGLPVGIVSAIAGSARFAVEVTGRAGHAGTTPMNMRRDAAAAAAEMLLSIEQRCSGSPGLVGTVGQLNVPKGSINTVPGTCVFSIDIRAGDDATRDAAIDDVLAGLAEIAGRRRVQLKTTRTLQAAAAPCAPRMMAVLEAAVARAGLPLRRLPSGAGHDAMMMARLTDIGMLFVRCGNGGISHHPDETLSEADTELAARIVLDVFRNFPI